MIFDGPSALTQRGDRTHRRVLFPAPSPETWHEPSCSTDTASQRGANRESGRRAARAQPGTRGGACGPRRVQPRTDHHFQLHPHSPIHGATFHLIPKQKSPGRLRDSGRKFLGTSLLAHGATVIFRRANFFGGPGGSSAKVIAIGVLEVGVTTCHGSVMSRSSDSSIW